MAKILIVDDEETIRYAFESFLRTKAVPSRSRAA
jgi:CheY-like chemotaxis protein